MRSSTSSKSNKPQRKHSAAADTVEAGVEIAATVAAVGDKVVVAGEEEAVARLRRELERGTFMLSRNDHKQHHDTPGFYCLRRYLVRYFDFLFWTARRISFGLSCWDISDLPVSEAFCMHAQELVLP